MTNQDLDAFLAAALAPAVRAPDARFADRMAMLAAEQQRFVRERRRIWSRAAQDALCAASVLGGLLILSRAERFAPFMAEHAFSIASPLSLVILLWVASHRWRLA